MCLEMAKPFWRLILGSIAVKDPTFVKKMARLYPIAVGIDGFAWQVGVDPALVGGIVVIDEYASSYFKTGEIVAALGSTAGVRYYGDTVTYPGNDKESIELSIVPYPVLSGAKKVALQRGAGFVVAHSDPRHERAAIEFLKWFTAAEQNLRFIRETGYLPVTKQAFETGLDAEIQLTQFSDVKQQLAVAKQMHSEYHFVVPPVQENLARLTQDYESAIKQTMREGRQRVLSGEDAATVSAELRSGFPR